MTTGEIAARRQTTDLAWRRLARATGISGLATMVLIFVPALARSGLEPAFDAPAADVLVYLRSIHSPLANFGSFVMTVGLIAFLWFIIGLSMLLRDAEGDPPWRSAIAAASGLVLLALALAANTEAAAFRVDDISAQIARYAFDEGNLSFANGWVALGSFAACSGWVITSTGVFARWLGWSAIASGVGLVLSRAAWTSEIWLLPYAVFWLWVLATSIVLLRRASSSRVRAAERFPPRLSR